MLRIGWVAVFISGLIVGSVFVSLAAIAWTGPGTSPPQGNVSSPVNVGTTDQVKSGGLSVNALAVFGNAIVAGASRYLNFGTTPGAGGYGLRDNGGTMQFKNSNGVWTNIPALATSPVVPGTVCGARRLTCNGATEYFDGSGAIGFGGGGGATSANVECDGAVITANCPANTSIPPTVSGCPAGYAGMALWMSGDSWILHCRKT